MSMKKKILSAVFFLSVLAILGFGVAAFSLSEYPSESRSGVLGPTCSISDDAGEPPIGTVSFPGNSLAPFYLVATETPCQKACSCKADVAGENCVYCMKKKMGYNGAVAWCSGAGGYCAINRQKTCGWNEAEVRACQASATSA